MGETIYIHCSSQAESDGPTALLFSSGASPVYTGLEVHTEEDIHLLAELSRLGGLTFFCQGQEPALYGVPKLCVFAADGRGGFLASTGDLENGPVFHILPSLLARPAAPCFAALLQWAVEDPDWRQQHLSGGPWTRLEEDRAGRAALAKVLGLPRPWPEGPADSATAPHVFPARKAAERAFPIRDLWEVLRQKQTPRFQVWPMMSPADRAGRAYVHYKAWHETYTGLMDQRVLDQHTLERCRSIAEKHRKNTLVLLDRAREDRVAGFACYVPKARDFVSVPEAAEVSALYLLSAYQGLGLGQMLLEACLSRLTRPRVALFVLQGNQQAIRFYEHMGFSMTGHRLTDQIAGAGLTELEMVLDRSR